MITKLRFENNANISETGVYLRSCQDSWFGCCPDDKSPAQGPENAGCPSMCGCNKIGKYE